MPLLEARIVVPLRVGRILGVVGRQHALGVVEAGGLHHAADRGRHVGEDLHRLPAELGGLADGLRAELRRGVDQQHVGIERLQLDDVAVDGRLGDFIGFLGDDHRGAFLAEAVLGALQVVFAEVVVLIKDRHLGVRLLLHDVLDVDLRLALVRRLPADRPRERLRIVPLAGAGGDEQLRHLLGVEILLDRRIGGRAERVEHRQHFIALDQLAHLLHRLRGRVGVVVADEVDLAAVDAALFVDHPEVGFLGLADGAVSRRRARIGHDVADLDLGIGRAGVVFLLGESGAGECGKTDGDGCRGGKRARTEGGHQYRLLGIFDSSCVDVEVRSRLNTLLAYAATKSGITTALRQAAKCRRAINRQAVWESAMAQLSCAARRRSPGRTVPNGRRRTASSGAARSDGSRPRRCSP